jgi:hypothetical protein
MGEIWFTKMVNPSGARNMKINDPVRIYDGEWFSEGRVKSIADDGITVDFLDWVQRFQPDNLRADFIYFQEVWVVTGGGEMLADFRN